MASQRKANTSTTKDPTLGYFLIMVWRPIESSRKSNPNNPCERIETRFDLEEGRWLNYQDLQGVRVGIGSHQED